MASIYKEAVVDVAAAAAWDAIRDVGAIHRRLAKRMVTDTRLERDCRVVTFADGSVVRERLVTVDAAARRFVYSIVEWSGTHHNASFQVFADGERRCRVVWIADLLPDSMAAVVGGMMEQGIADIKRTLEESGV